MSKAFASQADLADKQVTFTQQFVSTGDVQWTLEMTVAGKASAAGKVVIGTAKKTIKRTGRPKVTIKLNKRGRKHLRSMRKGKLTIVTHFKRKGAKKTLKATKTVKVKIKHGK